MAKCWFCGTGVSDNPEYSQSIEVGLIKKQEKMICEQCSTCLKYIENVNSSDDDVNKLLAKMRKNNYMSSQAERYINEKVSKRNLKRSGKKNVLYCVRGTGVLVPNICTNCLCKTNNKETLINIESSSYNRGLKTITDYKIKKLQFGLCEECRKTRKRKSARIMAALNGDVYSMAFTNEAYAKIYAQLNHSNVYTIEDDYEFEDKTRDLYNWVRYCWLYATKIFSIILIVVIACIILAELLGI